MQKIDLPIKTNEASPTNPDFNWGFKMLLIFVLFVVFSYLVFLGFSKVILANIDLETEKDWFWEIAVEQDFDYSKYTDYKIEEFKKYNFYLKDSDEINAYAFLWGNINITQGFLDSIENQEELIFVMAHEMAHIKNRDVLKAFTTEIPLQLTMILLWFDIWIWDTSIVSVWWKYLSKNTELNADKLAIEILKKYKINPICVKPFFEKEHNIWDSAMEMMSSHPLNSTRIELLDNLAKELWFTDNKNCKKIESDI